VAVGFVVGLGIGQGPGTFGPSVQVLSPERSFALSPSLGPSRGPLLVPLSPSPDHPVLV
jgi:hypothetical protein